MDELIEELRKLAEWPDDYGPASINDIAERAAAALEAAREDPCVALVADIRFACGDNGKRMQPELVEFIRGLAEDAGRYQWLRDDAVHYSTDDGTPHPWVVFGTGSGDCVPHWEHDLDAAIDQALGKAGQEVGDGSG